MSSPNDPAAKERRGRALELHLAGASYQAIANALGYGNKGTAYAAVQKALKDAQSEQAAAAVAEHAQSELARLDAMLTGLWPKARKGDLGAVDRVLKIEERRAQILLRDHIAEQNGTTQTTGLSEFEKRLREREQRATQTARRS